MKKYFKLHKGVFVDMGIDRSISGSGVLVVGERVVKYNMSFHNMDGYNIGEFDGEESDIMTIIESTEHMEDVTTVEAVNEIIASGKVDTKYIDGEIIIK